MTEPLVVPAVLKVPEAAEILGLSAFTVGQMVRDGRLPKLVGLRHVRIPRRAVLELKALIDGNEDGRSERIAAARAEMAECSMLPKEYGPGRCQACGNELTGLRRRWCSDQCYGAWWVNHSWTFARRYAIEQAGGDAAPCALCGTVVGWSAEVNHIVPLAGKGYGRGCRHHQANLEVLCHGCHVIETTRQLQERRAMA